MRKKKTAGQQGPVRSAQFSRYGSAASHRLDHVPSPSSQTPSPSSQTEWIARRVGEADARVDSWIAAEVHVVAHVLGHEIELGLGSKRWYFENASLKLSGGSDCLRSFFQGGITRLADLILHTPWSGAVGHLTQSDRDAACAPLGASGCGCVAACSPAGASGCGFVAACDPSSSAARGATQATILHADAHRRRSSSRSGAASAWTCGPP